MGKADGGENQFGARVQQKTAFHSAGIRYERANRTFMTHTRHFPVVFDDRDDPVKHPSFVHEAEVLGPIDSSQKIGQ